MKPLLTIFTILTLSFCSCDDDTASSEPNPVITPTVNTPSPTHMDISAQDGRQLFKENCAMCHAINGGEVNGPGMQGVINRVPQPYDKWLLKYIKNNIAVRKSGDAYANKIYDDCGRKTMSVLILY